MEERKAPAATNSSPAAVTRNNVGSKKKSIFTDIVHLAGLSDCNSKINGARDSILDLRTKSAALSPPHHPSQSAASNSDHRPSPDSITGLSAFTRKPPSTVADRNHHQPHPNHSFSAFAASPSSFFNSEPFSPFVSSPAAFHDFLPSVLAVQSSNSGSTVPCWSPNYSAAHAAAAAAAASFLSPLSFRSQFSPIAYNLNMQMELGMNGVDPSCLIASGQSLVGGPGGGRGGKLHHGGPTESAALGPAGSGPSAVARVKQAPRFQCPDCSRVYSTFSGLSKHRQFHCAAQLKRQFGCKYCQKHYTSLGALKMHIRTHTLPCKCELCGKAFSRPWLLQGHVRTHTGEKPFRCVHCGRAFADRSNLRAHLQTHSDVKKYRCVCCQKTFSRMSLLTKHEANGCPGVNSSHG